MKITTADELEAWLLVIGFKKYLIPADGDGRIHFYSLIERGRDPTYPEVLLKGRRLMAAFVLQQDLRTLVVTIGTGRHRCRIRRMIPDPQGGTMMFQGKPRPAIKHIVEKNVPVAWVQERVQKFIPMLFPSEGDTL